MKELVLMGMSMILRIFNVSALKHQAKGQLLANVSVMDELLCLKLLWWVPHHQQPR